MTYNEVSGQQSISCVRAGRRPKGKRPKQGGAVVKRAAASLFIIFVIFLYFMYNPGALEKIQDAAQEAWTTVHEKLQNMGITVGEWLTKDDRTVSDKDGEISTLQGEPEEKTFSILNIEIGTSYEEVEKKLGQPERITYNEYGTYWYTYHDNYKNFVNIMFDGQNRVAGLYTNQHILTSKNGIKLGITKKETENILGPPQNEIQKGNYRYLLNEDDYQLYFIDNCYVTFFYDLHNNETLTSVLIISKEMEDRKKGLYGAGSRIREGFEYQLFDLVNATRVRFHLHPLKWDENVRNTARKHSKDMAENNYFSHTNLEGQSPFERMREDRIFFTFAGENLAYGQFNSIFAHEGLMNSESHRENILRPEFEYVGIGVAFNSDSQPFFTQNFYKK